MFTLGSIVWPTDRREATRLYLDCITSIAREVGVSFEAPTPNNPVELAGMFILGNIDESDLREACSKWWAIIDKNNWIREFQSPVALEARMAICLLSIPSDESSGYADGLSWFLELIHLLDLDARRATDLMASYFKRQADKK